VIGRATGRLLQGSRPERSERDFPSCRGRDAQGARVLGCATPAGRDRRGWRGDRTRGGAGVSCASASSTTKTHGPRWRARGVWGAGRLKGSRIRDDMKPAGLDGRPLATLTRLRDIRLKTGVGSAYCERGLVRAGRPRGNACGRCSPVARWKASRRETDRRQQASPVRSGEVGPPEPGSIRGGTRGGFSPLEGVLRNLVFVGRDHEGSLGGLMGRRPDVERPPRAAGWMVLAAVVVGGMGAALRVVNNGGRSRDLNGGTHRPVSRRLIRHDHRLAGLPEALAGPRAACSRSHNSPFRGAARISPLFTAGHRGRPVAATAGRTLAPPAISGPGVT